MNRPMRARWRQLILPVLCALAFLLLLMQLKSSANLYDEGLVLVNAERIRHGEIPYRDFWTLYAPGYFYALAALFAVVEPTILAARWFDIVLRFGLVIEVYLLARVMTSRWVALVPAAFVTYWLATIRFYSYPAFPAAGAILLAALALARYLEGRRMRWLFVAGLALGITAILRLDFGGYAAIGFAAAVALAAWRRPGGDTSPPSPPLPRGEGGATSPPAPLPRGEGGGNAPPPSQGGGWGVGGRLMARAVALLAGGALLAALPLYAYLVGAAGFATVFEDLVHFPATVFREVRHLPVPPLLPEFGRITGAQWNDWLRLYLPLTVYAAALAVAARWLIVRPVPSADRRFSVGLLCLALTGAGLGLVIKATSRYHELHALPTTICAAVVVTALLYQAPPRLWRSLPFKLAFAGLASLLLTGPYVVHFAMLAARNPTSPAGCYSELPRAGCVPVGRDQAQVAEYIRVQTQPGEYVFFGNARHDLIFVNDLLVYFLADRPSPTKYTELHPGLATTLPVQQTIARELAEKDVRWVVTMKGWESREPNASSISSGVTTLDDAIRANYRPETAFGSYQVWRKR